MRAGGWAESSVACSGLHSKPTSCVPLPACVRTAQELAAAIEQMNTYDAWWALTGHCAVMWHGRVAWGRQACERAWPVTVLRAESAMHMLPHPHHAHPACTAHVRPQPCVLHHGIARAAEVNRGLNPMCNTIITTIITTTAIARAAGRWMQRPSACWRRWAWAGT